MTKLVYKQNVQRWHMMHEPVQKEQQIGIPSSQKLHKMLDFFAAGDYGYALVSVKLGEIETFCERLRGILGIASPTKLSEFSSICLKPSEKELLERKSFDFFEALPPGDQKFYKARFDYCINHSTKGRRRIFQQIIPLEIEDEGAIRNYLFIFTDITYIKRSGATKFAVVHKGEGKPIQKTVLVDHQVNNPFSARERQILGCLIENLTPKQIAEKYRLSLHTIYNHKKSMLRKSNCKSSIEVVAKAFKSEWV